MFDKTKIKHSPSDIKVALLAGGKSNERDISLKSAEGAKGALEEAGYTVDIVDPSIPSDLAKLIDGDYGFGFIVAHGKGGEDGVIQGFLETIGLPYTGSGVTASAIAMNKAKAKMFYERDGVPTPPSTMLHKAAYEADEFSPKALLGGMDGKVVVKVPTEGSSIGVYIVDSQSELDDALSKAFAMTDEVLIERYISGREFTCVVFGSGNDAITFPVIEIIPQNDSYDFESKYAPGGSKHVCPAEIPDSISLQMSKNAIKAHNSLGCEGVTRTDFLLEENGDMWALETNTIPGMTATSLLPDAARADGISFPELCMMMVQSGLDAER